jgi:hypothetical protein
VIFVTNYRHHVFTARHHACKDQIMSALCVGFGAELRESTADLSRFTCWWPFRRLLPCPGW